MSRMVPSIPTAKAVGSALTLPRTSPVGMPSCDTGDAAFVREEEVGETQLRGVCLLLPLVVGGDGHDRHSLLREARMRVLEGQGQRIAALAGRP